MSESKEAAVASAAAVAAIGASKNSIDWATLSRDAQFVDAEDAPEEVLLDGESLTPELLVAVGYNAKVKRVGLTEDAWRNVAAGRDVVDKVLARGETVYGINTGFGNFSHVKISSGDLEELQYNLIRSHAAGVGNYLTPQQTRMLLALRINVLAKGHSGIRTETVEKMLAALNANCLSAVPTKGTVGASGDLAPLSHLALGLLGEGEMWDPKSQTYRPAGNVLTENNLTPIRLTAKEGLALINGTQLIASVGAEAVVRARRIARQADVVGCLTLEALQASMRPFHPLIHAARNHRGQNLTAGRARCLLNFGGEISEVSRSHVDCGKIQDSYTLRCMSQIHGVTHDTVAWVHGVLTDELNSATDNPMVFAEESISHKSWLLDTRKPEEKALAGDSSGEVGAKRKAEHAPEPEDAAAASGGNHTPRPLKRYRSFTNLNQGIILSGGNFHGEYPAKMCDYLAIGVHELSSVAERRIERLVNPALSPHHVPAFCVENGGLNSGFMIAHCTAAALVSENKVLCHPASVDSLSTSAAQEDHVSMGGFAARKALKVVRHVEYCVAIELLCAVQALEFSRPAKTTEPLEKVVALVRKSVPGWNKDRFMAPDIEAAVKLLREGSIWRAVEPFIDSAFRAFETMPAVSNLRKHAQNASRKGHTSAHAY